MFFGRRDSSDRHKRIAELMTRVGGLGRTCFREGSIALGAGEASLREGLARLGRGRG